MFPGIFTTLPVNMIPLAEFDPDRVYPRGNLQTDASEKKNDEGGNAS